jgi:hypothetical protein
MPFVREITLKNTIIKRYKLAYAMAMLSLPVTRYPFTDDAIDS